MSDQKDKQKQHGYWQRTCGQIAQAAGRLQHQARLSPQATEDHWESHRRMMAQLLAELQAVMPGEGK